MGIVFGIIGPLLVLALLGAGVAALLRGRLTFAALVHAYAAVVLGVCVVLALVGGAFLLKAGFSEAVSRDFSYRTAEYPYAGPYERPSGVPSAERAAATAARDDVATGVTLLIIGAVLGTLHGFGKVAAGRRNRDYAPFVDRGFDIVMLLVATGVGLVSSVMLLNDLLRRYVVTDDARPAYQLPQPGGALAFVVTFLPLWIIFGARVWRALLGGKPRDAGEARDGTVTGQTSVAEGGR